MTLVKGGSTKLSIVALAAPSGSVTMTSKQPATFQSLSTYNKRDIDGQKQF